MARARAAKVSIIRFTQRSWTAVRTDSSSFEATAEMKVRRTAVMFTVSWNCVWVVSIIVSLIFLHSHE